MPLWARGKTQEVPQSPLQRRIARTSTHDLVLWLDAAVLGLGRLTDDYRRTPDGPALVEIEDGATVVAAVAAELRSR